MSTITPLRRLVRQVAAVQEIRPEMPRVKVLVLRIPEWPGHRAGQHLDVRLTAENGYQAQRSYDIGSAPEAPHVSIAVKATEDGEVSPYLKEVPQPGSQLELRGPVGAYFTWDVRDGGPLLLVAGDSGIVPLVAASVPGRRAVQDLRPPAVLRTDPGRSDLRLGAEMGGGGRSLAGRGSHADAGAPRGVGQAHTRRIDREMLEAVSRAPADEPRILICGPMALVESVANHFRGWDMLPSGSRRSDSAQPEAPDAKR